MLYRFYAETKDRASAYEILTEELNRTSSEKEQQKLEKQQQKEQEKASKETKKSTSGIFKSVLTGLIIPIARQYVNSSIRESKKSSKKKK